MSNADQPKPAANTQESALRGVLDPAWEEALLRGRDEAEGEAAQGSIEPELTALHLLRHLREPEALSMAELDQGWADIDHAIAPAKQRFWQQSWFRWLAPVGAAAAIALVVVRPGADLGEGSAAPAVARADDTQKRMADEAPLPPPAAAAPEAKSASVDEAEIEEELPSTAALLERQFEMLEPAARAKVGASVESERGSMRAALISNARGGGR